MKNLFKKTMLFAAAAMAFVSCENDITDVNTLPGIDVTVNATVEGTKSHFGDYNTTDKTYPTVWDGTEKWAVCLNNTKVDAEEIEFSNGNTAASATVTFNEPEAYNGTYTLFAVSPLARYVSISMENDYIRFRVPGSQTPSTTSCDPAAQVLIAQSEASETVSGFDVAFKHATAYGKFSFVNVAEGGTVTGVTIKSADVAIAGRYVYAPSTKTISFKDEAAYEINLTTNTTTDLWFACGPAEVQGKKLTFIINTDKGKLEKEVTMPGNFVEGKVATFKIDMAGIDYPVVEEAIQYKKVTSLAEITAGEYVIVHDKQGLGASVLTNALASSAGPSCVALSAKATVNNDILTNVDESVIWNFIGTNTAMQVQSYADNTLYLYATSTNNGIRINTYGSTHNWKFEKSDSSSEFSMQHTATSRFCGVYSTTNWRCYTTVDQGNYGTTNSGATGAYLTLYKKVGGSEGGETPETPAPELTITSATTINVDAAGDVPTITYTIANPVEGRSVTASANQSWVNGFEVSSTGVTFIVDENTGAAREATVTLSYTGAESKTVTVSQAAGNTGGGDDPEQGGTHFVKVTSAPSDWSGTYLIVYETGNLAFNGSLSTLDASYNTTSVTISDSKIEATDAMKAIAFTIEANGTSWSIKSASGYYIGQTADGNKLLSSTSTKYTNSIEYNDGNVDIVASGKPYLRYNATSGQERFRYFKSSTYSSQKAIQLYKLN